MLEQIQELPSKTKATAKSALWIPNWLKVRVRHGVTRELSIAV